MDNPAVYISLTIVAAFGFAMAAVLQQREAVKAPSDTALKPSLFVQLARRPIWLLGVGLYAIAYAFQVVAVGLGPVVIIQPLISVQLVFALILGAWLTHRRASLQEWLGALAVVVGIAIFIIAMNPSAGDPHASAGGWIIASSIVIVLTVVALVVGWRLSGAPRSALYGIASGLMWGLMIVFMKTVTAQFTGSSSIWSKLGHMFTTPYVYCLAVTAIVGFLFLQSAFQAGSLTNALAAYTVVEIVVAVILGIILFGERPHHSPIELAFTFIAAAIMFAGIVTLARSPIVAGQMDDSG